MMIKYVIEAINTPTINSDGTVILPELLYNINEGRFRFSEILSHTDMTLIVRVHMFTGSRSSNGTFTFEKNFSNEIRLIGPAQLNLVQPLTYIMHFEQNPFNEASHAFLKPPLYKSNTLWITVSGEMFIKPKDDWIYLAIVTKPYWKTMGLSPGIEEELEMYNSISEI